MFNLIEQDWDFWGIQDDPKSLITKFVSYLDVDHSMRDIWGIYRLYHNAQCTIFNDLIRDQELKQWFTTLILPDSSLIKKSFETIDERSDRFIRRFIMRPNCAKDLLRIIGGNLSDNFNDISYALIKEWSEFLFNKKDVAAITYAKNLGPIAAVSGLNDLDKYISLFDQTFDLSSNDQDKRVMLYAFADAHFATAHRSSSLFSKHAKRRYLNELGDIPWAKRVLGI